MFIYQTSSRPFEQTLATPWRSSVGRNNQFIPNTCHGFDLYRTFLDLPAQMCNVNVHRACLTVEVEAPGFLQNLLAAHAESAVLDQGERKVKFLRAQVEAQGSEAGFTSGRVDHQIADVNRVGSVRLLS